MEEFVSNGGLTHRGKIIKSRKIKHKETPSKEQTAKDREFEIDTDTRLTPSEKDHLKKKVNVEMKEEGKAKRKIGGYK
jgi:ethanolamine utilization cobalamin adenosyltransferase